MSESVEQIAARHVAQSLDDLKDPARCERWANGERAREQAQEIVAQVLAEAEQRLNPEGQSDAS